jgi:hypothetical protein
MRVITAKFDSKCAETGRPIKKGDACVYDPQTKKVYASGSPTQQRFTQADKHDQGGDMLNEAIEQQSENWYSQEYDRYDHY